VNFHPALLGMITCPVQLKVNSETSQGPTLQGYKKEHGNGNRQRDVLEVGNSLGFMNLIRDDLTISNTVVHILLELNTLPRPILDDDQKWLKRF